MELMHAVFCTLILGNSYASPVKITGTVEQSLKTTNSHALANNHIKPIKKIKLLKVELNNQFRENLIAEVNHPEAIKQNLKAPTAKDLGMGNVPVLDQGMHGTCVTFANTAAIDAAMEKGHYLSQLCQLQLGNYLSQHGYTPSGWGGSWGKTVLNQMATFGIVSLENQRTSGCAGLKEYPINDFQGTEASMSPEEYHAISDDLSEYVHWSSILDVDQLDDEDLDKNAILEQVKKSLNEGDRLTFGVLLMDLEQGTVGAVASNKALNDTWALTPDIIEHLYDNPDFGGHEMIIVGYDDNAVAKDSEGHTYKGLLHLRNSWGTSIGDKGDFYMSYAYFKTLALEVSRIRTYKDEE